MNHNDLSQCRVDTDRLLIAPFTAADADDVYQAITPTLTRFMAFEPEASPEDFANVWQGWLPLMREGEEV
ncbi:GNAT family N-acetyltransferase, partial [Serratia marcescens]